MKYLLVAILIVALLCLGLGIYIAVRKPTVIVQTTQQPAASPQSGDDIQIPSDKIWTNSGITLTKGQRVTVTAQGQINLAPEGDAADKWIDADGWGYIPVFNGPTGQRNKFVYVADSLGCLVGRIGSSKPFKVGSHLSFTATSSGPLFLGVNDGISDSDGKILSEAQANSYLYANNRGSFRVQVQK